MQKRKILVSLSVIAAVAAIAVSGTIAYFNDTETSKGNILIAGTLDLKIDHLKQTYNGIDCNTCSVEIKSDTSNLVTGTTAGNDPVNFPHNAVPVTMTSITNQYWTANIPGAAWIWATDPVTQNDSDNTVTYKFEKDFTWLGPVNGASMSLVVGADNNYTVYLNGDLVNSNNSGGSFAAPDTIDISSYVDQGANTLRIDVTNLGQPQLPPANNPAGLLYKLTINGSCQDNYFKTYCNLWAAKDLTDEKFFNFDDIKPGDQGTNVISIHINNNDGWTCMMINNKTDSEVSLTEPEQEAGDVTANMGELSQFIKIFGWNDIDQDGIYEPPTEAQLFQTSLADPVVAIPVADSTTGNPITGASTKYVGLAWCIGTQTVNGSTGAITCDGSGVGNIAQTDTALADLVIYAEQWRNNLNFKCSSLILNQLVNGGFETDNTEGWNINGTADVVETYGSYGPVEGSKFLVLTSGTAGAYTIASQNVAMKAGQKLKGKAAFDAGDYLPYNDDAAVVVVSGGPLATPWSESVATVGDYGQSAWEDWSWTAPSDGTYTLELKVRNYGDSVNNSFGLFDANVATQ